MLAHLLGAQTDLEAALAQLHTTGDAALIAQGVAQRALLADLQLTLATTGSTNLTAIRGAITAAVSATASLGQQSRSAVTQASAAELATTRAESRGQVQSLLRDLHRFDPYLRFASPEDEEAYRRREAERRAYIEDQHRRGTPEGDLNASAAAIGQMVDADSHGAGASPEFRDRWNELVGTTRRLRDQVARSGSSTQEFDDRLRAELRGTLRARGISEAEIDARLAAHPGDPLAAVEQFMRSEEDVRALDRSVADIGRRESIAPSSPPVIIPVAESPTGAVGMAEIMAEFRATGVVPEEHSPGESFAHGVTAVERALRPRGVV